MFKVFGEGKKGVRHKIESFDDLYQHADAFKVSVAMYDAEA